MDTASMFSSCIHSGIDCENIGEGAMTTPVGRTMFWGFLMGIRIQK